MKPNAGLDPIFRAELFPEKANSQSRNTRCLYRGFAANANDTFSLHPRNTAYPRKTSHPPKTAHPPLAPCVSFGLQNGFLPYSTHRHPTNEIQWKTAK